MSIGTPPLKSSLPAGKEVAVWTQPWAAWFTALSQSVFGWGKTYTATLSKTWASIAAHDEASQTVTITGVRSGDLVIVTPATKTTGIVDNIGVVTASDTVTVYAQNTTGSPIVPGAKTYRIICFQQ